MEVAIFMMGNIVGLAINALIFIFLGFYYGEYAPGTVFDNKLTRVVMFGLIFIPYSLLIVAFVLIVVLAIRAAMKFGRVFIRDGVIKL